MFARVYNLLVLSKWRNAMVINVVGGLEHEFYFSIYWEWKIIPTDFHSIIFLEG
jgi:hypothetical protein